jgi:hypothetical protein
MSEFSEHDPNTSDTRTPEERQADYAKALREQEDDRIAAAEVEERQRASDVVPVLQRAENVPSVGEVVMDEPKAADLERERYGDPAKLNRESTKRHRKP